jgi:hypothetical protein
MKAEVIPAIADVYFEIVRIFNCKFLKNLFGFIIFAH